MFKLVSANGRWAYKDNSMIFSNVVWLCEEDNKRLYHLIDDNKNEITDDVDKYLVDE